MKKLKKVFLLSSLLPILAFASCAKQDAPTNEQKTTDTQKTTEEQKTTPTVDLNAPYLLNKNWEANREEDYYTINSVDDGIKVSYKDVNEYRYVKRSFSFDDTANFSRFKYLYIEASIDLKSGSDEVLLKMEYPAGTGDNKETRLKLTNTKTAYQFEIDEVNWSSIPSLVLFFNPGGSELGEGVATFYNISLRTSSTSEAKITASLNSPRPNVYDGKSAEFDLKNYWYGNDGVFNIGRLASNNSRLVSYNKKAGNEWESIYTTIKPSEGIGKFRQAKLDIKGTKDKTALLKLESVPVEGQQTVAKESAVTFTGKDDSFLLELPAGIVNRSFTLRIFPEQGISDVEGSLTINSASLVTTEVENSTQSIFESDSVDFYSKWEKDEHYTLSYSKPYVNINWNASKGEWANCHTFFGGSKVSEYKKIVITFQGTENQKVLFKLDLGNVEKWVEKMTGKEETVELEFKEDLDYTVYNKLLVFGNGGGTGTTGEILIKSIKLAK